LKKESETLKKESEASKKESEALKKESEALKKKGLERRQHPQRWRSSLFLATTG
jgi:hypothetical protein